MLKITKDYIRNSIADTEVIYKRGEAIFLTGNYSAEKYHNESGEFNYTIDGNYGDYKIKINILDDKVNSRCSCPYPRKGCKHVVAACLDIAEKISVDKINNQFEGELNYLTSDKMKSIALKERKKSAEIEMFKFIEGDTIKGEHTIINKNNKHYIVTIHNPLEKSGHCTCMDFATNYLGTCKHLMFAYNNLENNPNFKKASLEKFPFIHVFWDSYENKPRYYSDSDLHKDLSEDLNEYFSDIKLYRHKNISNLFVLIKKLADRKEIKFDKYLIKRINAVLLEKEIEKAKNNFKIDFSSIKADLYPYQKEGIEFAVFKKSVIIGDEMGLGKTIQAITASLIKKDFYNFKKALIVCPSSLKAQWKKEIEKFTDEKALIVSGTKSNRKDIYSNNSTFFKIANYEAVMRDIIEIKQYCPDIIILDEAQRIKNFTTKTHQVIKAIPHKHSIVLSGTPLENKLDDLFSIVQFADNDFLGPLWNFAANHYLMIKKTKKVVGYKNIESLNKKISSLII